MKLHQSERELPPPTAKRKGEGWGGGQFFIPRKRAIALVALTLFFVAVQAQEAVSLRWTKQLGPGVTYRQEARLAEPLVIHALRFKYPAEGIRFETLLARDRVFERDGATSRETVDAMARRTGAFAAVNADFFGYDGDPLGVQVKRGQLVSEPHVPRSAAAWGDSRLHFDAPSFQGTLTNHLGDRIAIDGINRSARVNEIIVNTSRAGVASSKEQCYAFVFLVSEQPALGQETELTLINVFPEVQNRPVRDDEVVVLMTPSRARPFLNTIRLREKWTLRLDLRGSVDWAAMREAIGGGPRLVRDGKPAVNHTAERFDRTFSSTRHPRTALGYTAEGEVVIAVVDGRSPVSRGVSLEELAAIMVDLGCVDAINLDGGGSSTLYLAGAVANRPSDGATRSVANALLLYLPDPPPPATQITLQATVRAIPVGSALTLRAVTQEGAPIANPDVYWTSTGRAGWVDQGGTVRGLAPGKIRVRALARGATAEIELEIIAGK